MGLRWPRIAKPSLQSKKFGKSFDLMCLGEAKFTNKYLGIKYFAEIPEAGKDLYV